MKKETVYAALEQVAKLYLTRCRGGKAEDAARGLFDTLTYSSDRTQVLGFFDDLLEKELLEKLEWTWRDNEREWDTAVLVEYRKLVREESEKRYEKDRKARKWDEHEKELEVAKEAADASDDVPF